MCVGSRVGGQQEFIFRPVRYLRGATSCMEWHLPISQKKKLRLQGVIDVSEFTQLVAELA